MLRTLEWFRASMHSILHPSSCLPGRIHKHHSSGLKMISPGICAKASWFLIHPDCSSCDHVYDKKALGFLSPGRYVRRQATSMHFLKSGCLYSLHALSPYILGRLQHRGSVLSQSFHDFSYPWERTGMPFLPKNTRAGYGVHVQHKTSVFSFQRQGALAPSGSEIIYCHKYGQLSPPLNSPTENCVFTLEDKSGLMT